MSQAIGISFCSQTWTRVLWRSPGYCERKMLLRSLCVCWGYMMCVLEMRRHPMAAEKKEWEKTLHPKIIIMFSNCSNRLNITSFFIYNFKWILPYNVSVQIFNPSLRLWLLQPLNFSTVPPGPLFWSPSYVSFIKICIQENIKLCIQIILASCKCMFAI